MVGRTAKRGRPSPSPGRNPSSAGACPATRSSSRDTPRKTGGAPASGALTQRNATGTAPAGATPGVAEIEALVQAINLLPADIRRQLAAREGVLPSSSSSSVATFRYDDARLDDSYEQCIAPYIPEQLQADIEAVEWSEIDQLLTRACHSAELRKPGEDGAIKDMLRDMWYEQRLDTRPKPQPAHVLDLLKKKPAETAVDKALRELQDGPVRD